RLRTTPLADILAQRRASALNIKSFSDTQIAGSVRIASDGVLVLQMPFDRGWHAIVDGQDAPALKVDAGLEGVMLKSGEHAVKLVYRPPFLLPGAVVSVFACAVFLLALWKYPRVE